MKKSVFIVLSVLFVSLFGDFSLSAEKKRKPNVVFFLVDDLGWADVVWHKEGNPDVQQPHVAELIKEAIILSFVC